VDIGAARSWLFVPGDRSERFPKAASSGADVVVCDLEDAVGPEAKPRARSAVVDWLSGGGRACVRINAGDTRWYGEDVDALAGLPGLRAVMVPKAEDPQAIAELSAALGAGTQIVALVETAQGLRRVDALAAAPGLARIAFGSLDFALDVRSEETDLALLFARSTLVVSSRAAGLPPPVDGVTTALEDCWAVTAAAARASELGFGGKLCIHPNQVDAVNAAFSPTPEEIRYAFRVIDSLTEGGVGRLDGQMVDRPVVARARAVLRRAGVAAPETDRLPEGRR
jgi:citrate lyase subunit beta/citryl-CoA lyase